jgi:hypothetical protein
MVCRGNLVVSVLVSSMPGIIMAFKTYRLVKPPADAFIKQVYFSLIKSPGSGWITSDT